MQPASGSQFGGWLDDAGHNHGDDEVALTAGSRVEDGIQMQVAQATEDGGDVAVGKRARDVKGMGQGGRWCCQRAGQSRTEGVNLLGGKMGDVGEGASLDFAVLTVRLAQEDGGRGVAVGDGGDVHAYIILDHDLIYKQNIAILHAYKNQESLKLLTSSKHGVFTFYRSELRASHQSPRCRGISPRNLSQCVSIVVFCAW